MPDIRMSRNNPFMSRARRRVTTSAVLAGLLFTAQVGVAGAQSSSVNNQPNYAAGLYLGGFGVGASISGKTNWSLITGDQIQWRTSLSGNNIDSVGDINGIDYDDVDASLIAFKLGLDWYPYQRGWADGVFFSAGVLGVDNQFYGAADTDKEFSVGGVKVYPGTINSLETDIEYSGISPYLSFGWGGKLTKKRGFDFQAEIGLTYQVSDTNVSVLVDDPDGILTLENVAAEEDEIKDELGDINVFASVTISYLF